MSISASTLNNQGDTLTVRWSATDSSGIAFEWGDYQTKFRLYGHSYERHGGQSTYRDWWIREENYTDTILVSGDPMNGVFEGTVTRPGASWGGTFDLVIWARDSSQNQTAPNPISEEVIYGYVYVGE